MQGEEHPNRFQNKRTGNYAYLFAGGERPNRRESNHEWTIHHIYDGKFALESGKPSVRAVNHGDHFSHSAGVVAIHPIADALADEYFLLRLDAEARILQTVWIPP